MAIDASDLLMTKMMEDDRGTGWGGIGFLWVILIFLFFLAFSGNGLFGNRGAMAVQQVATNDLSQVERDILAGTAHLFERRKDRAEQPQPEPVYSWPARKLVQQSLCEPLPLL